MPISATPDFTVIIPTKDRPMMLMRALRSVLVQTHGSYEIVVADDGDGAGIDAANSFAHQRTAAFSTGRSGQVPARNQAVRRAKGRWIAFLDDDDWWDDPDHLSAMANMLEGGGGLAYASGAVVPDDGGPALPFTARCDAGSIRTDNLLLVSGLAYEAELHARLGAFDESLPIYWDWDWYLRLVTAGVRVSDTGRDGVRIAMHGGNVSAGNDAKRAAELARLCAKHGLAHIALRNHESIARDQQADASTPHSERSGGGHGPSELAPG